MTQLLEQAFEAVRNLSDSEQDVIAALILAELEDDQRWEAAFSQSHDKLAALAQKARDDVRAGRIRDVGIDEL
jgi:hypothetical protein